MKKTNGKNGHGKRGHNSKSNGNGSTGYYRAYAYNWIDKDPIIDRVKTIVQDEGISHAKLSIISGVSAATYSNWFEGSTRRPQYATVAATIMSLGYVAEFVKSKKIDFEKEIKKAKLELERRT